MAGTTVGEAFVTIRPDTAGFETDAKRSVGAIIGGIATGFAAIKVKQFFSDSFAEAEEAQKVGAQTEAVLRSTGNAANVTAEQIGNLASKLSEVAAVDDEVIQSGANLLLTFKGVQNQAGAGNKIFDRTLAVALDLSTAMGTDLNGAIVQVGKALNDPTVGLTALTRVGVTFTEQQKEQIKALQSSGNLLGAQKIILKELTSEFGGSAAAQATATAKLNVAFGNLKESVGTALLPVISGLAKALEPVAKFFAENRIAAAALAVVVGGVLVAAMTAWTISMLSSTVATLGLTAAVSALGTGIGAVTVIMAPWLAAVALAAGLYMGLKHAITGAGMSNNVYASSLMGATKAELAQAAALVLATRGYDGLKDKVREVAATSLTTARKMVEAADLPAKKRRELLAVIDAEERSQRRAQKASEDDARAKQRQASKIDDVKTSLEDLNNYIRLQVDDTLNLESAQISMERSIQDLGAALRSTTLDTIEGRQAFNDTKSSIVNWGNQVAKSAELAGKTTEEATQDQINSLGFLAGTLAPGSPLRTWLEGYINQLRIGIPNDVNTNVNVNSDDAEARLKRLLADIQALLMTSLLGVNVFVGPDGNILRVEGKGAEGAIVNRPTLALIGEAGPEAVVPLHKVAGNQALPTSLGAAASGGDTFNIYTIATEPVPFALEVSRRMRREMFLAGR